MAPKCGRSKMVMQRVSNPSTRVRFSSPAPKYVAVAKWLMHRIANPKIGGSNPLSDSKYIHVAQLVEHWSPKPGVEGSSPSVYAKQKCGRSKMVMQRVSNPSTRVRFSSPAPFIEEYANWTKRHDFDS